MESDRELKKGKASGGAEAYPWTSSQSTRVLGNVFITSAEELGVVQSLSGPQ